MLITGITQTNHKQKVGFKANYQEVEKLLPKTANNMNAHITFQNGLSNILTIEILNKNIRGVNSTLHNASELAKNIAKKGDVDTAMSISESIGFVKASLFDAIKQYHVGKNHIQPTKR